jgi:hypothetical protein
MKNLLFSLMLTVMCGMSAYGAIFSNTMNEFVGGSMAMCISAVLFIVHSHYPLFKSK